MTIKAQTNPILERPARPGEKCKCGRPAIVIYITEN